MEKKKKMNAEKCIEFITNELLPEAVQNRCFCEAESREFIEYVSAKVESLMPENNEWEKSSVKYYRARMIINFSGEPNIFSLIIKLLFLDNNVDDERNYDKFINEEMFYNKMTKKYKLNVYPKCYVADMGRYGLPVIVLEDLESDGFVRVDDKLDEDHLTLCLRAIEGLHERGLRLKADNFNSFREFYAKLIDTRSHTESKNTFTDQSKRISSVLKKLRYGENSKIDLEDEEDAVTICHGNLSPTKSFFFRYENKKPIDVKIIGWNSMRYCSILFDLECILRDHISTESDVEKYLNVYLNAANVIN